MDLTLLQKTLRQFAAERDWGPFHTPKNLAMALMVEVAEIAEIFQWMTPEQSQTAHSDKVEQDRIGDEVADVLLYLLQLADHCGIDLKRAVGRKLQKNALKHPPIRPGLPAGPLARLADEVHVLIDWENVQPNQAQLHALVPDATDLWLFHGKTQKVEDLHTGFGDKRTLIPITQPGKNALDFHLSFYTGYISSRHPDARIVVISNDQGYRPMLEHAGELGFRAGLVGMPRPAAKTAGAKVATPKKKAAPKTTVAPAVPGAKKSAGIKKAAANVPKAAKKPVPAKAVAPAGMKAVVTIAAIRALPDGPKITEKEYAHVLASIRKQKQPPTRQARLLGAVRSLLDGGKAPDAKVTAALDRLVAERQVVIDGNGAVRLV